MLLPDAASAPTVDLWYGTSGPHDAEIVLVGEAWGADEEAQRRPFVGASGNELTRMLTEAGLSRSKILITNVVAARPPNNELWKLFNGSSPLRGLYPNQFVLSELSRLYSQINHHPRKLIIVAGNYALWALSDLCGDSPVPHSDGARAPTGISNWRGSMIHVNSSIINGEAVALLPILHPAAILRDWSLRNITVHDLRSRVPMATNNLWTNPKPPVLIAPGTFTQTTNILTGWLAKADYTPLRLTADIETSRGLITCIGFADSPSFALTIPFVRKVPEGLDSYWTPREEAEILHLLIRLLTHPRIDLEGQNFLYDTQYIAHHWGVTPYASFDSMYAWHVCFPGTPKALDYLSSLFCRYHRYWKEDHKDWNLESGDLGSLLRYNAEDCVRTYEVCTAIRALVKDYGLSDQWMWMRRKRDLALSMMQRGVAIDSTLRNRLGYELMEKQRELAADILRIIPQEWAGEPGKSSKTKEPVLWYSSPKQTKWVFGEFLGIPIPTSRKTGTETLGKEALNELRERHPIWTPLFDLLSDLRSVGVFITHFIRAPLDPDRRMRCSFNPAGTETFRWSSSKNAFGRGANLQNLPKGDDA